MRLEWIGRLLVNILHFTVKKQFFVFVQNIGQLVPHAGAHVLCERVGEATG